MFDLAAYLEQQRARVDAALERALPPEAEPPAALHRSMRYSVLGGGKRVRPVLCLAAADAIRPDVAGAIHPAVAVELLHTYTLIHDDLPAMDDDDLRRGRPTNHKVFGEAVAILAGDALQALAFEVLACATPAPPCGAGALVAELARAAGSRGVAGGQTEDMLCDPASLTRTAVDWIHEHKTGDLFVAAVRMGALAAGAGEQPLAALTGFAVALGHAFQVVDDLLDARASSPGKERREVSCVSVYGEAGARAEADRLTAQCLRALDGVRGNTEPLAALARSMLTRTT